MTYKLTFKGSYRRADSVCRFDVGRVLVLDNPPAVWPVMTCSAANQHVSPSSGNSCVVHRFHDVSARKLSISSSSALLNVGVTSTVTVVRNGYAPKSRTWQITLATSSNAY